MSAENTYTNPATEPLDDLEGADLDRAVEVHTRMEQRTRAALGLSRGSPPDQDDGRDWECKGDDSGAQRVASAVTGDLIERGFWKHSEELKCRKGYRTMKTMPRNFFSHPNWERARAAFNDDAKAV